MVSTLSRRCLAIRVALLSGFRPTCPPTPLVDTHLTVASTACQFNDSPCRTRSRFEMPFLGRPRQSILLTRCRSARRESESLARAARLGEAGPAHARKQRAPAGIARLAVTLCPQRVMARCWSSGDIARAVNKKGRGFAALGLWLPERNPLRNNRTWLGNPARAPARGSIC